MIDEQKFLKAISERRQRHGNIVVTLDLLEAIFVGAANPTNFSWQPPAQPAQLYVKPEFPKRKIRAGENKEVVEERIVHSHAEETALRKSGQPWYTWEEG
jgi:hypothetical protein